MNKYIFKIALIALSLVAFSACSDDDDQGGASGGTPVVRYIRPCDATVADSLLSSAYLGERIAIIGENLGSVNAIYFNDQKAKLNPNFVTGNAIIVTIPSVIPGEKQDLIKLYTGKDSCYYEFETKVPVPNVKSMTCEYVPDGGIAYIQGLYFVNEEANPLKVQFSGNVEGEVISVDVNNIAVRVPEGAQNGPIRVTSVYGTGESVLNFRDSRNIILDFDTRYPDGDFKHGWHGGTGYGTEGGLNGQYLIMSGEVKIDAEGNVSTEDAKFCYDRWAYHEDAADFFDAGKLEGYALKFEVNVTQTWSAAPLQVIFSGGKDAWMNWQETSNGGNPNEAFKWATDYPRALWMPWKATGSYTTNGWITVTIPMTDFKYNDTGADIGVNAAGHYAGITLFVGKSGGATGTACTPTFHIDNVRVVKAQ